MSTEGRTPPWPAWTCRAEKVLRLAEDEARLAGHAYVGTAHILLGLLSEGEGVAMGVLASLRGEVPSLQDARSTVHRLFGTSQPEPNYQSAINSEEIDNSPSEERIREIVREEIRRRELTHRPAQSPYDAGVKRP